jgi:RNA polymerase sigma-70 factor (ECF subfamily)
MTEDPRRLLDLARAGDTTAWEQLLEGYRAYLVLLARTPIGRRLQGKADPEDLVQETLLQAYRCRVQFQGRTEAELLGWLRAILASRVEKLLRRYLGTERRDVRLERAWAEELEQSSCVLDGGLLARGSSPSHQAARREQGVLLAQALAQLPVQYREVLILRHVEQCTFPEIAERLGKTKNAVEKLWKRALACLQDVLGGPP